jgi:sugar/nucleoside kinase (ribokinase family)
MNQPEVISMGNMLVEIMRIQLDEPLNEVGTFTGPYPSGDTPIYIDTVARLGHPAGFIGAVGKDDFGHCLLERFTRDGVDFSCGRVLPDHTTGVAFVAYFKDGSRKFIYHMRYAATGQLGPDYLDKDYFSQAKWLHITGCNLAMSQTSQRACYLAMDYLPAGAQLSFDPNIRPELLSAAEIRELCGPVIQRAGFILPSLGEAAMLTGAASDEAGITQWVAQGKTVVLKMGAQGSRIYRGSEQFDAPGFQVQEVDPTGAGDSFSAAFTVAMLEGMPLPTAGRFANAVGALAVTRKGPMEGAPTRENVEAFLQQQS